MVFPTISTSFTSRRKLSLLWLWIVIGEGEQKALTLSGRLTSQDQGCSAGCGPFIGRQPCTQAIRQGFDIWVKLRVCGLVRGDLRGLSHHPGGTENSTSKLALAELDLVMDSPGKDGVVFPRDTFSCPRKVDIWTLAFSRLDRIT